MREKSILLMAFMLPNMTSAQGFTSAVATTVDLAMQTNKAALSLERSEMALGSTCIPWLLTNTP